VRSAVPDERVARVNRAPVREERAHVLYWMIAARRPRYVQARNHPGEEVTSGLSPYLHFGHISAHEVFERVVASEDWSPARLADRATGRREGWWGAGAAVDAFLDQLVTWRELGYHEAARRPDHARYESPPASSGPGPRARRCR
jgi:deoxyribodipyrimidine photo-lyase